MKEIVINLVDPNTAVQSFFFCFVFCCKSIVFVESLVFEG